ncbi:MAG TPA: GNAT family N-acetyltransferase [Anaerolineae bacterium]|nr:GNAT family N-acetyltransferase [Anaerolineae bacterium]HIQ04374.1 GNAT family N-acetyltransferase [Anaerolineae bacterium]
MRIRPADLPDLSACLQLDTSFETDHVWQIEQREEDGVISLHIRPVRLPRTMRARYPNPGEGLLARWQRGDCVLVADLEGELLGYVEMSPNPDQLLGWVHHLTVAKAYRRHGIGTALLEAATQWAQTRNLTRLVVPVQSKNYPAIRFCLKNGFTFCGLNDRYYRNGDIALLFARSIR